MAFNFSTFDGTLVVDNENGDEWSDFSGALHIEASGGAPPAWNNTMNEIAAPGAVNEITNANIQSVNEI